MHDYKGSICISSKILTQALPNFHGWLPTQRRRAKSGDQSMCSAGG